MLPNLFAQHGPIPVQVEPQFLPIGADGKPRIPSGLPEEYNRPQYSLTTGGALVLEANETSDPWYLYEVAILFASHAGSGAPVPDGPYGIYIVRGGKIIRRLIDAEVRLSTEVGNFKDLIRTCPFVEMPWALNRKDKLVFVYGLISPDEADDSTGSPSRTDLIFGLTIRYIIRR